MSNKIRVLVAKPGLDGHDRGAKVVSLALRDAGFEVIYTGLHQTIDQIVEIIIQEDVDVIGLSILSGAHIPLTASLMEKLQQKGVQGKIVLVGGNIPEKDIPALIDFGVTGVFPTGSQFNDIVSLIRQSLGNELKS